MPQDLQSIIKQHKQIKLELSTKLELQTLCIIRRFGIKRFSIYKLQWPKW
jgi:hypothetical protein